MVYDFDYVGERYLDNFAVGALHLNGRRSEGLCGLHAADYAAHSAAILCDYLNVVFAIKRL